MTTKKSKEKICGGFWIQKGNSTIAQEDQRRYKSFGCSNPPLFESYLIGGRLLLNSEHITMLPTLVSPELCKSCRCHHFVLFFLRGVTSGGQLQWHPLPEITSPFKLHHHHLARLLHQSTLSYKLHLMAYDGEQLGADTLSEGRTGDQSVILILFIRLLRRICCLFLGSLRLCVLPCFLF